MQKYFAFFEKYVDWGLLLFRLGLGSMFIWHGAPKIFGGVERWTALGKAMGTLGITFAPAFWGFMAGFSEFFGGLMFLIGFMYRPACFLLLSTMSVAAFSQLIDGKGFLKASQSIENGFSFLGALFVGPGKYSVDAYLGLNQPQSAAAAGKPALKTN